MFHVSFRYIFGIPPLILALLPVTSSDCDIKGKEGKEFEHVLMISFNELEKMIEVDSDCVNNESNFFKRHSCGDSKEAAFLNRATRKLNQFLKMNMSEDFKLHLSRISEGTLKLLSCPSKLLELSSYPADGHCGTIQPLIMMKKFIFFRSKGPYHTHRFHSHLPFLYLKDLIEG
ncbi:interleukin-7 isoform X1 [Marmota monax]|uniref:interleukin-7 isoform X1 n=2 Tax=Marmota monax TaxID=9995 RepID=UPI001EAFA708|nr:interleukin-7 isoform X1 [Marmota monax]